MPDPSKGALEKQKQTEKEEKERQHAEVSQPEVPVV